MIKKSPEELLVNRKNKMVMQLAVLLSQLKTLNIDKLCDKKLREAIKDHPALELHKPKIQPGMLVRLTAEARKNHTCPKERMNHKTAVVRARLDSYIEGALQMERDLAGCQYWNEDDVEIVV